MQKNYFLTIVFTAIMILSGCNCKEDPQPVAKSMTELLLHNGAAWKVVAATVDPPAPYKGTFVTDFYSQFEVCDKDNTYLFSANPITATNGSYTENNPVKCNASDLSTYTGTWQLNGQDLVMQSNGNSHTETILSITDTELKTKYVFPSQSGINYTVTQTYK